MPEKEARETAPKTNLQQIREITSLSGIAADSGIKVVPTTRWGFHYPHNAPLRTAAIQGLLDGSITTEAVRGIFQPDAYGYSLDDLQNQGFEATVARIRSATAIAANFDSRRFADFVRACRGTTLDASAIEKLYEQLTQGRVQKKLIDTYGYTGRQQMDQALKFETENVLTNISAAQSDVDRVMQALKLDWLADSRRVVSPQKVAEVLQGLSADQTQLFSQLRDLYRYYCETGNENAYQQLVSQLRDQFIPKEKINDTDSKGGSEKMSEEMEKLKEELEPFMDQVGLPGTKGDPGIPAQDEDEYHTPEPDNQASQELLQQSENFFFQITPPLGGYYCSGRKSYYDIATKTWSKKKQLSEYRDSNLGKDRYTIGGKVGSGITSIPIPNGYALEFNSLQVIGGKLRILRDQNGCFYINADQESTFTINFGKENSPFINPPIQEDLDHLYSGQLSADTEAVVSSVTGDNITKAEILRNYLLTHHHYPAGGDLQAAQALQYKLRSESSADNYIQNLDSSHYLECYSANTLYIAMLRKAGIPSRLVTGHHVEGAKDGKSNISDKTGHAWTEIWDGQMWRRMDATPKPKPEDKKKEGDEKKDPAAEAEDGGIEVKDEKNEQDSSQKQDGQTGEKSGKQSTDQKSEANDSSPSQTSEQAQMSEDEISDSELEQGQKQVEQAQQINQQKQERKNELDQKAKEAKIFQKLQELKDQIEKEEIFEDMKVDLEQKIEAIEEQMKQEMQQQITEMTDDGFMDETRKDQIEKAIEKADLSQLDKIRQLIDQESKLYDEYEKIKEEVMPFVEQWYRYFAENLPHEDEIDTDEDSRTRQGSFDRRSVNRMRNLLFGTIKNPRVIRPDIRPRFLASIMVDVSGSMADNNKLTDARKLLVFYCELFNKISSEFGYIRFAINTFSDSINAIKTFDQDYQSREHYQFGSQSLTIKSRLMKDIKATGGTNMLDAVKQAAVDLNREKEGYQDTYASAFYFIGDGEDTCGNSGNVSRFLQIYEREHGFGDHMRNAILLGSEKDRSTLSAIFGDKHTKVASNFESLIEVAMLSFNDDMEQYLTGMTR